MARFGPASRRRRSRRPAGAQLLQSPVQQASQRPASQPAPGPNWVKCPTLNAYAVKLYNYHASVIVARRYYTTSIHLILDVAHVVPYIMRDSERVCRQATNGGR